MFVCHVRQTQTRPRPATSKPIAPAIQGLPDPMGNRVAFAWLESSRPLVVQLNVASVLLGNIQPPSVLDRTFAKRAKLIQCRQFQVPK